MSAIIFQTSDDGILVAMDTFTTHFEPDSKELPTCSETSKGLVFVHLQTLVCGVGLANLVNDWKIFINGGFSVTTVSDLNMQAPIHLKSLAKRGGYDLKRFPTVIFHFGFDPSRNLLVSGCFDSDDNFNYKPIPSDSFSSCPKISPPDDYLLPRDFKKLMLMQMEGEQSKPRSERVGIGGSLCMFEIKKHCIITSNLGGFH